MLSPHKCINIKHIRRARHALTMMNVTCRKCLCIELHRTVAVVTKTGIVHHEAHAQLSSVAQSFCCLLKALKAKLLIITPLSYALCSLHFTLHCIMFCPFLLFLLSPWVTAPWGNEGGNHESFPGVWNSLQVRTHVFHGWLCDSFVWAVKPE